MQVKTRLTLQSYQSALAPLGWLREEDVKRWVLDLYPSLTHKLSQSADYTNDPKFLESYSAAAVRSFFFFLDPHSLGRVSVERLVTSPVTDALLEVTLIAEEGEAALTDKELQNLNNNW